MWNNDKRKLFKLEGKGGDRKHKEGNGKNRTGKDRKAGKTENEKGKVPGRYEEDKQGGNLPKENRNEGNKGECLEMEKWNIQP